MSLVVIDLPYNFTYSAIKEIEDSVLFRIKEVTDESSAKAWVQAFSSENNTTWRVLRTFPNSGKINLFKCTYRCQHSTDKRAKGLRSTKNTNCPAELEITIKRFIKKSKAKHPDLVSKEYPTFVYLKHNHNHSTNTEETLRYGDMLPEIREKLFTLFHNGHSPSSALQSHKNDLKLEFGEQYNEMAVNAKYVPSLSKIDKLFRKEFASKNPNSVQSSSNENVSVEHTYHKQNVSPSEKQQKGLGNLFNRIQNGLKSDPRLFVPAVKKMLENARIVARSKHDFLSALYTFGSTRIKLNKRKKNRQRFVLQPTIARRKFLLHRKGRDITETSESVHPCLKEHDYAIIFSQTMERQVTRNNIQSELNDSGHPFAFVTCSS